MIGQIFQKLDFVAGMEIDGYTRFPVIFSNRRRTANDRPKTCWPVSSSQQQILERFPLHNNQIFVDFFYTMKKAETILVAILEIPISISISGNGCPILVKPFFSPPQKTANFVHFQMKTENLNFWKLFPTAQNSSSTTQNPSSTAPNPFFLSFWSRVPDNKLFLFSKQIGFLVFFDKIQFSAIPGWGKVRPNGCHQNCRCWTKKNFSGVEIPSQWEHAFWARDAWTMSFETLSFRRAHS